MSSTIKNQREILDKLKIEKLNPMQEAAQLAIHTHTDVVLLSPTGTGKTLAFLLPIIAQLDPINTEIQALILVPSRELAIQIEQVTREMGTGYKTNAVFGGRTGNQDKINLKHRPAILIGTPGRVADHMRREVFSCEFINTLVLDEFDKSLEVGFENEMKDILTLLPNLKKRILTSATNEVEVPKFVGLTTPTLVDYLHEGIAQLKIKTIVSPSKDKLETLVQTLSHLGNQPGIVFCNFKETIQRLSDFLTKKNIPHGCFYGGIEQQDRERALLKFRNGTHQLLIATDLAARGIDVPEIKFIIHYQLPPRSQEFTHRNGRTARMNSEGTAYVLKWVNEYLPDFINAPEIEQLKDAPLPSESLWQTLHITGGRRDKISKGDVAGFLMKQGNLSKEQLGVIEIQQNCCYVGVHATVANELIQTIDNTKLKTKKVRVSLV